MSGTSANYAVNKSGILLPAPKVFLRTAPAGSFQVSAESASQGVLKCSTLAGIGVTLPGISRAILDARDTLKPLLELMVYRAKSTRFSANNGGNGNRKAGYKHPSNGPAASGDGNLTHGGFHQGCSAEITALRQTEWPVLQQTQRFDVTQSVLSFMCVGNMPYRSLGGVIQNAVVAYPAHAARKRFLSGRYRAYPSGYQSGFFQFRLSVIDQTDPRGKRIHGPLSDRIEVGNAQHAFLPQPPELGFPIVTEVIGRNPTLFNIWLANRLAG